mmetsp:Transcript_31185/g.87443  ORF Transcript_31185/g.87443 Transcript_31185/m.87443 type:complete len:318 (-) Transcript_31185:2509-3462(-)
MVGGIPRTDVARDGIGNQAVVQLRRGQRRPHIVLFHLGGVLMRPLQAVQVVQQHLDCGDVQVELLVDGEGFLEELAAHGNLPDRWPIERVQARDVVHDARLVRLDRREDQEVLQVGVAAEGRVLQNDLLQQLDQLVRQLRGHEGFHRHRHLLRVLALWERSGHYLVNQRPAVGVVLREHLRPQLGVHPLHNISGLSLEQAVLVRAFHEGVVALATFVGHARQGGVPLLAVFAHHQAVVIRVGREEVLRVVVGVDHNLPQGVVHMGVLRALVDEVVQEAREQFDAVALLHLSHQRLHRQQGPHREDQVGDERLVAFEV